jgi:hypothetical protein
MMNYELGINDDWPIFDFQSSSKVGLLFYDVTPDRRRNGNLIEVFFSGI